MISIFEFNFKTIPAKITLLNNASKREKRINGEDNFQNAFFGFEIESTL